MKKTRLDLANEYAYIHECVDNTEFKSYEIKFKVLECIAKAYAHDLELYSTLGLFKEDND